MSSFTDDELSAVADAFGTHRNEDYSDALVTRVVNDHLLPNLIRAEMNFQGTAVGMRSAHALTAAMCTNRR